MMCKMNNWKWCLEVDGKVVKGWYFDNSNWYHLNNETGILDTGWFQDKDSRWYYLDEVNGDLKTGWIQLKGIWYYLEPNSTGYMGECYVSRTEIIDGKSYSFDSNGHMLEDSLISDNLVEFIKGWEAFYSKAYYDGYGYTDTYLTIGYGTTKASNESAFPNGINSTCTEEQATQWLKDEINKVAKNIKLALGDTVISQQAFDCLCDIGYNAGTGSLVGGNTWKAIISGSNIAITNALMSWNKANGIVSNGLTKRCRARVDMCLNGVYNSMH
jgi:lysozyme